MYHYSTYCNNVGVAHTILILNSFLFYRRKPSESCVVKKQNGIHRNIFSESKVLKFNDINAYLTSRFVYKCYKENVPGVFSGLFSCNSDVYGYSTRQSEHSHAPLERGNLCFYTLPWCICLECDLKSNYGGSRLIQVLQLHRYLRSLDGSTGSGGSPKCFTYPDAV